MMTSTTLAGCNAFLGPGGAVSADSGTIRFSRLVNNEGMVWFPPQYFTHYGDDITGSIDATVQLVGCKQHCIIAGDGRCCVFSPILS